MLPGGPGPSKLALSGLPVAPWDVLFVILKICQKIDLSKTHLCGAMFTISAEITKKVRKIRLIWGPSLSHFYRFFKVSVFSSNFGHFSMKKLKNKKMNKCLPICKIQCFVRVATLKKTREAPKICDEKSSNFSLKIDPISSQKIKPNQVCYRNHKNNVTWGTFSVHWSIFGQFWSPKGGPKWSKMDDTDL